jgi:16S rRNA C967 or C1407 C5-methylase (RsmB/RsmF family)
MAMSIVRYCNYLTALSVALFVQVLALAQLRKKDGLLDVTRFYPESFDRILLDPPCSALGLRPKLFVTQTTLDDLKYFASNQRCFARQAVALLKPGGIMTYSTCTIHGFENEAMVRHVLDEYPIMELLPIDINLGLPGLGGFGLDERECSFVRRFDPADKKADTMGFFIAKFQKKI